jgi:hypothetical protein
VLPDREFVQMAGTTSNKFKLSVAGALHPAAKMVPNWNTLTNLSGRFDAHRLLPAAVCR